MDKILQQSPILLQLVGSQKKLGFGCDTDYRGFFLGGPRFERHDKVDGIDYDIWNKDFAVKQIKRGLNSCPILYSCLFGGNYTILTEEGQELINSREQFRSQKLVKGCLRFCDRKIEQSKRKNQKRSSGKYVYYACTDMFEQLEILETGDCQYPLRFNDDEYKLVLDLRENNNVPIGYAWYEEMKNKIQKIKI